MPASNKRYSLIVADTKESADTSLAPCTEEAVNAPYAAVVENLMGNAAWTEDALNADHVTMTWPLIDEYDVPLPAWYAIEYVLDNNETIVGYRVIWSAE